MINRALEMLKDQADNSAQELAKIRTQITESFSQNYVITPSTMENLIKVQKSVAHWARVKNIISRHSTPEEQVAGLEEWIQRSSEQLLECGRSRSTSLIASAEYEAEEDELKQVLRQVKQFVSFARSHS